MKLVLSLAAALLFSVSALATEAQNRLEIRVSPSAAQTQGNQNYSYDFGQVNVRFSRYADFDFTNASSTPLVIHSINIIGHDFSAFYNCPSILPPGAICLIRVRFQPWQEGFKSGNLLVHTSNGMIQVRLSGWARSF